jgi:hypothetical protein
LPFRCSGAGSWAATERGTKMAKINPIQTNNDMLLFLTFFSSQF